MKVIGQQRNSRMCVICGLDNQFGVRDVLETMTRQLQVMMYRTASKDLKHIDPSVIWQK